MTSLPADLPADFKWAAALLEKLRAVYRPDEVNNIIANQTVQSEISFWVNSLKPPIQVPSGEAVSGLAGVYKRAVDDEFTYTKAVMDGHVYIQNAASYFAVAVLDPQPQEEILDLAAAPGGKTVAIAGAMHNTGRLAAVEPIKGRFHRLRANLARCAVTNADLYCRDGRGVGRVVPERFDRVLLDAPCSSESHMRWDDPKSYAHWSPRKVKECQRKQKQLIRSAYAALKPGGVLVYCTCSFSPEENELVVAHLLAKTGAIIEPVAPLLSHFRPGLTTWSNKNLPDALSTTARILPQGVWDGFYVAKIRKVA